jgi:hypothetical protein
MALADASSRPPGVAFDGVDARDVPDPPDACACMKGSGAWGNGGFHFRRFGAQDVSRQVDRALAELPKGSSDADREFVEKSTAARHTKYLGLHVAYERCPAFLAACEREIRERRDSTPRRGLGLVGSDL